MTKILYIPTGDYLKFKCADFNESSRTVIIENSEIIRRKTSAEKIILWLVYEAHINKNISNAFLNSNNIVCPVVQEEFEIIND